MGGGDIREGGVVQGQSVVYAKMRDIKLSQKSREKIMISIIMLVHGAPVYTKNTIETLQGTRGEFELIVLDNASDIKTKKLLLKLQDRGWIDKLIYSRDNTLFAKGNNIAFRGCAEKSDKIVLLNSDIDIRNKDWLIEMEKLHTRGITTLGAVIDNPWTRGDGYCFMIDKDLYEKYQLDEEFEWWWSITKLQAQVLKEGLPVVAVQNHENLLFHYGGMSGGDFKDARGMQTDGEEVKKWFEKRKIKVVESIKNDHTAFNPKSKANRLYKKLQK